MPRLNKCTSTVLNKNAKKKKKTSQPLFYKTAFGTKIKEILDMVFFLFFRTYIWSIVGDLEQLPSNHESDDKVPNKIKQTG